MFYEIPISLNQDITEYEDLVEKYIKGDVKKVKFKAIRVPMGVYEQRDNEKYMMRIRLPGGGINPDQLIGIATIAEKYTVIPLHFTTRQQIQIHSLELPDTVKIMKELMLLGLTCRGGGGNTVRNVMGSFDTGTAENETFDISPYVQALTSRLISESDSWTLPRKLKIAFSSSSIDTGLATVNDLGFIAKIDESGKKGFTVYIAGGLGSKPQVGKRLFDFIEESEVYNIAKATKNLFDKHGNRKNKHKARLRFLFRKWGREKFLEMFNKELVSVREKSYHPLEIKSENSIKKGNFIIPLFLGDLSAQKVKKLGQVLKGYGEDVLRVTTTQNLFIRNIAEEEISPLMEKCRKAGIFKKIPTFIANFVACAGASTCKLGICLSRGLANAIKEELMMKENTLNSGIIKDLQLKISGCPNTCGHHMIADIGFFGRTKRFENKLVPFYSLVVGAIIEEGKSRLAQEVALLPAKNVPKFLAEFLDHVTNSINEGESFLEYLERIGFNLIKILEEKFKIVPSFNKNRSFYYDWDSNEQFSLASRGIGECSAGLFDLIDWDFSNIDDYFNQLIDTKDPQTILRKIVVSASRSLLITKGMEPKTEKSAVELFRDNFIPLHIDKKHLSLLEKYLKNEDILIEETKFLVQKVRELYQNMDNSLRFPELTEQKTSLSKKQLENYRGISSNSTQDKNEIFKINQSRDYRGVKCPINFIKVKNDLRKMKPGENLNVLLDDGESIENVPKSAVEQGHKILDQCKIDDYWSVIIERCED